jgi:hypothetical protein
MSDLLESFEEGEKAALARGDTIVTAAADELLVDLDNAVQREQFDRVWPVVVREFGAEILTRWPSKSGGIHEHVQITLSLAGDDFTVPERIALQAALGSDPVRDVLTLQRFRLGIAEPIRLFRPSASPVLVSAGPTTTPIDDDDLPF